MKGKDPRREKEGKPRRAKNRRGQKRRGNAWKRDRDRLGVL